jgi:glycosyltransferase involved in cell wall biosynthesis
MRERTCGSLSSGRFAAPLFLPFGDGRGEPGLLATLDRVHGVRFGVDVTACWRPQRVGMLTVAVELARALIQRREGDEIVLLCSRERPAALEGLPAQAVLAPFRHELALKTRWLPRVETELDLDAILYPYWPSPRWRRAAAPPAVVFVHDLAFRLRPAEVPWQQRLYFTTVLAPALTGAAAVLVPSEATRKDLLGAYRLPGLESRITVVPEGVPHAADPGPLPDGLLPGFILAVGTVEPRKNYPRLLEAYRRLRRAAVPMVVAGQPGVPPLVIAGRPGWAYGDTLTRIRAEPGVRYLGHVSESTLTALYESASVLALPSLYEGFGLPLLEAMANGLPAVIGRVGSLPELAGNAAIDVDPEDVEAIASALEELLADEGLRRRLGDAGRRRAAGLTWDRAGEITLGVLRSVARRPQGSVVGSPE